jgi:hypothetical protein
MLIQTVDDGTYNLYFTMFRKHWCLTHHKAYIRRRRQSRLQIYKTKFYSPPDTVFGSDMVTKNIALEETYLVNSQS